MTLAGQWHTKEEDDVILQFSNVLKTENHQYPYCLSYAGLVQHRRYQLFPTRLGASLSLLVKECLLELSMTNLRVGRPDYAYCYRKNTNERQIHLGYNR